MRKVSFNVFLTKMFARGARHIKNERLI